MRAFLFILSIFICTLAQAQVAQEVKPKLSPLTRHYLKQLKTAKEKTLPGYIYNKKAGITYISALIKVSDAALAQQNIERIGAIIGTKAGRVWTVKVPLDKVTEFTQLSGIKYIQLDEPVQPHLDVARKTTRVDSAQAGYGLPMGYSGKNVVIGVIDFGFDYNHPTFYDTFGTSYRIKKVWEMNATGTPPAGYSYGKEITDTNLIKSEGTDDPHQNHGTSTSGMAAGSGFGGTTNGRFRGMAYEAELVLVGVRRDSIGGEWMQGSFSDFLDGVNYIFNYATSVGKPAVINISWGSQSGSHDGTSLFNEACDSLSGPGKIVVMSAGNEGEEKIHISKTFTPTDTVVKTYLTFSPATYRRTWVDIWGQPGKTFCANTTLYHNGTAGHTTGYMCLNDSVTDMYLIGANGTDTCYVEYITSTAENNGKPRITINIYNKSTDSIGVAVRATDGKIDMWDEYYYYGFPHHFQSAFDSLGDATAISGNTISTVSDMGSAQSVLLIGGYASKVAFTDINGNSWTYASYVGANRLVPFSSRGPMIDGRIKPDITAPALTIATSTSSYDTSYTATGTNSRSVIARYTDGTGHSYYYSEFTGTSAAGPAASGIVALLLQANPALTPVTLKNILFQTAIKDIYTTALPPAGNNDWGHGKINAYGALKLTIDKLGVPEIAAKKPDCTLFPNPNDGSFTLQYNGDEAAKLNIYVYDVAGSIVCMQPWQVVKGINQNKISLSQAAKGMYIVKVASVYASAEFKTLVR